MSVYDIYNEAVPGIHKLVNCSEEELLKLRDMHVRGLKRAQKQLGVIIEHWEEKKGKSISIDAYQQTEIDRREAELKRQKRDNEELGEVQQGEGFEEGM